MSSNVEPINNTQNNGSFTSSVTTSDDASDSSIDQAKSHINELSTTIHTGDYSTRRANNRRYSYGGIRDGSQQPTGTANDNSNVDTIHTGDYSTRRANNRRYSYGGIRDGSQQPSGSANDNSDVDTIHTGDYSTRRANNRRYSYGGIRDANQSTGQDSDQNIDSSVSSPRYVAGQKHNVANTRRLTAKDSLFQRQDNNLYSYGTNTGYGQLQTRDEALDSLFYSDVANAMIDNGFALTRGQQADIKSYNHQFSDEFAAFASVRSDLLYTQAAIVDGLISNGAFLTAQQEIDLGIDGSLSQAS